MNQISRFFCLCILLAIVQSFTLHNGQDFHLSKQTLQQKRIYSEKWQQTKMSQKQDYQEYGRNIKLLDDYKKQIQNERETGRLLAIMNTAKVPYYKMGKNEQQQCREYTQGQLKQVYGNRWKIINIQAQIQKNNVICRCNITLNLQCIQLDYTLNLYKAVNEQVTQMEGQYKNIQNISNVTLIKANKPYTLPYLQQIDRQLRNTLNMADQYTIWQTHYCSPIYHIKYKHLYDQSQIKVQLLYDPITEYVQVISTKQTPY